jgi:type VII secretion protein EccB
VQSRRDQVQAHMFVMGRLTSGVLRLEPDGLDQPVSRTGRGVMGGLAVAVLIGLVVALYGFIKPGGNQGWKTDGALVVVKDSGARYLNLDGVLHPVMNLASAKLLAGDRMKVSSVSAKSMRDAPRGAPVGLVGAPDALPDSRQLTHGAWMSCAVRVRDDTGAISTRLALAIGLTPAGRTLGAGEAVPVAGPDGHDYLLWNGQRLRMDRTENVVAAVASAGAQFPPVSAAFLNTVPAGPDLTVPVTPGLGQVGPPLGGFPTRIGQLFSDGTGNRYLLTGQGLVALTPTLFALYTSDPRTQAKAYRGQAIEVRPLGPGDMAGHLAPPSATAALTHDGALPVDVPHVDQLSLTQAVCQRIVPAGGPGVVPAARQVIVDVADVTGEAPDAEPGITPGCLAAQSISVRPGAGAVVNASLGGGGAGAAYFLVTDGGVKYPVPDGDSLGALGYGEETAAVLPAGWLDLLPTGPVLSPSAVTLNAVAPNGASRAACGAARPSVPAGKGLRG